MLHSNENSLMLQLATVENHNFYIEVENGNVRANLTQMAKDFGTDPKQWLRTTESESYLNALAVRRICRTADLVQVRQGGIPHLQGTWAYDKALVVNFARWLDPFFGIAVDDLIFDLLAGNKVIAEPFMGVWPLIINGKAHYYYRDVLKAVGLSTTSGSVYRRIKQFPNQFNKNYYRQFCTYEMCNYLLEQSKLEQKKKALQAKPSNQLNLEL